MTMALVTGTDFVTLPTDDFERAIAFYRRHGFHETGEVVRDHRGLDDLRMARLLGPRGDLVR